jgi:hypothetical protein
MKRSKCPECGGSGRVAVDHRAWISGGSVYEEDVMEDCPLCRCGDSPIDKENLDIFEKWAGELTEF